MVATSLRNGSKIIPKWSQHGCQMGPGGLLEASWRSLGAGLGGPRRAPEQLWRPLGGVLEAWEHLRGVLVAPGAFAESSWSHLGTLVGPNGSHFGGLLGALFGILFETPFSTRFFVQWALFLGQFWARFSRVSEYTQGLLARRCNMQSPLNFLSVVHTF